ncbi:MAG: ATP-binding cassette domain-containing protein, partial [Actinomycetales bacterium]
MIEIRNLIVIYQSSPVNIIANRGIDLDIASKGMKVITGPNGSGKSTLFKVLSGEIEPSAGEIKLKEKLIPKREIAKTLGNSIEYAKQDLLLNPEYSGAQHLKRSGTFDQSNHTKLLNQLEIKDYWHIPINELTRDIRQLVGIALTLLSNKPILLLDEPTKYLA